ncbi:MAG TPA: hypothetical protein PKI08_10170, partial [Aquaticitalea sp.]|nr:hypothetical protein [Aquaticitalea sp.]
KAIENALPANTYYYIADNLGKDFIAPKTLGWKTIAFIDNGKNIHFDSYKHTESMYKPDAYIMSFKDICIK